MKTPYEWMMSIPPETPLLDLRAAIETMAAACQREALPSR